jgi:hypothetical protein
MLVGNGSAFCRSADRASIQQTLLRWVWCWPAPDGAGRWGESAWPGVAIDALVLSSTFALACWVGTRWLGMDRKTVMLMGRRRLICGAKRR